MATGGEVLMMLCPLGGWTVYGDDYDTIIWSDERPRCTKEQFEAGFAQYDAWKAEQNQKALAAKETAEAKLAALGLTTEDLRALGL